MQAVKGIKINGKEYPLPDFSSITLDEAIIITKHSGKTIKDLEESDGSDPGLIKAIIHIAIKRAEPYRNFKEISKTVGSLPIADLGIELDENEEVPLATDSESNKTESSQHSGETGSNGSGQSLGQTRLGNTGMPASAIG